MINFYDMGDASQAGTLQILPPDEYGGSLSDCVFSRNDGAALSSSPSMCQLNNVADVTGYNGQVTTVEVPIPKDYKCNEGSPTGCWFKVRAAFPGGVHDATTWSASIQGNPIRLVE